MRVICGSASYSIILGSEKRETFSLLTLMVYSISRKGGSQLCVACSVLDGLLNSSDRLNARSSQASSVLCVTDVSGTETGSEEGGDPLQ